MKTESKTRAFRPAALLGLLASLAATPVQAISTSTPTSAFLAVGNGVQVTPDWVLTVQHVALGVGQTYSNGYGSRTVAAVYTAPGSGTFPANDFALMRLAPSGGATAPYLFVSDITVPPGNFTPRPVTLASSVNTTGPRGYAFSTISESLLTADPDDSGPLQPVVVNWLVSVDSLVYVQGGDSGSALFAGNVQDSGLLLGIASAQFTDENNAPIGSAFVQAAAYRAWVDATMLADAADNQSIAWASAVPEPASAALCLAGLAVILPWRLRRQRRAA